MNSGSHGLGLNICYQIVEALGGKLYCESKLGHGSTFTFSFNANRVKDIPKKPEKTPVDTRAKMKNKAKKTNKKTKKMLKKKGEFETITESQDEDSSSAPEISQEEDLD
jgi:hypothetical protein